MSINNEKQQALQIVKQIDKICSNHIKCEGCPFLIYNDRTCLFNLDYYGCHSEVLEEGQQNLIIKEGN